MRFLSMFCISLALVSCAKANRTGSAPKPVTVIQPSFIVPTDAQIFDTNCVTKEVYTLGRVLNNDSTRVLGVTRTWLSEDQLLTNSLEETIDGFTKNFSTSIMSDLGGGMFRLNISTEEWKLTSSFWSKKDYGIERFINVETNATTGNEETTVIKNFENGIEVPFNWKFTKIGRDHNSYTMKKEHTKPAEMNHSGRDYIAYQIVCLYNARAPQQ